MPTVIDSLLVEIGLQSKDFDKNSAAVDEKLRRTREQAQITGKDTEDSAKKMGLSFAKVRGEVVGLFLAFAGAKSMVQFAENAINTAAAAGHLGAVLGQQTTTIHAWNSALEARGGQKGEAGGYFSKIAEFYADFTRHPEIIGQNAVLFAQLGLRGKEDFSNPEQLIYHLSDQYQREMANAGSNPGAQQQVKATFAQRMREFLGASNEMIDWVEHGTEAVRADVEERKRQAPLDQAAADAAEHYRATTTRLSDDLLVLFDDALLPGLNILLDLFDSLASGSGKVSDGMRDVALGMWGVFHPIALLLSTLESAGLISGDAARSAAAFANETPPEYLLQRGQTGDDNFGVEGGWDNASGNGGSGKGVGNTVAGAAHIEQYLRMAGFTDAQVQGIAAGIAAESGSLGYTKQQDGGYTFGIGQWRGDRIRQLQAYAKAHGSDAGSLDTQLSFLVGEIRGGRYDHGALGHAATADQALVTYIMRLMRPQGRFLSTLGHYENQAALEGDIRRGRHFNAGKLAHVGISVTVNAPGHPDPHKVARHTAKAVHQVLNKYHRVANSNSGMQ